MTTDDIDPTDEPVGAAGEVSPTEPAGAAPASDATGVPPASPPLDRADEVVTIDDMAGSAAVAAIDPEAERPRRRKAILLLGLLALLTAFSMFTAWYLIFRKPISELPLPGISDETLPHFAFSINGVNRPIGIVASPSGDRIYVTETAGDRTVIAYDGKGTEVARFVPPDSVPGSRTPVYVALDPLNGEVYVSDRVAGEIYVYSPDGTYRRTFEPEPKPADWQPLGLAFDAQGNLYVGDLGAPFHRIVQLGPRRCHPADDRHGRPVLLPQRHRRGCEGEHLRRRREPRAAPDHRP